MSAGEDTAPPGFLVRSDKSGQHKEHTFPGSGQSLTERAVVSRSLNTSWGGKEKGSERRGSEKMRYMEMLNTWRGANTAEAEENPP